MSLSDSMFLFEIVVEELKSYINNKGFYVRSQFSDVFTLDLRDPNELTTLLPKVTKMKKKKVRKIKDPPQKDSVEGKVQTGQSILFGSSIQKLTSTMNMFPLEISLWDKDNPNTQVGSTHIPWSLVYIEYLHKLYIQQDPAPAFVIGEYNVFDENTSKRMATIVLNIKLTYLKDKITSSFRSLSEANQKTFMYTGFNSKAVATVLSTVKEPSTNILKDTGVIKTIYSGGKRKLKNTNRVHSKAVENETLTETNTRTDIDVYQDNEINKTTMKDLTSSEKKHKVKHSIESLIKSDTDLKRDKEVEVAKSLSCTSVSQDHYNTLDYIFGDSDRPYGNQVYCVGYFTVENDFDKKQASSKSSLKGQSTEKSEDTPKERYKMRICDSECPSRMGDDQSVYSLDLPEEAADLITVTKCKQIECDNKKPKDPTSPDDAILFDLKSLTQECCGISQTVEEVTGGMKAKMKFNEDQCYCSCECTFGFVKKTTYCGVCGGYEKPGEDLSRKQPNAPFPCPIYHKLVDKNKLKSLSTSGSDTKKPKQSAKAVSKSPVEKTESEKDSKKGKNKKKDDRFKFNYGYTAPQIGHSECVMPCTGTMGVVPKNMGWLWTAENVPGIKFRPMWKPGATNKHVVRMLRMAKNPGQVITKKKRKDIGKKPLKRPLLVVHKKDGEYIVTMETMKTYPKPRQLNQQPYEDRPLITYTVGRTEEENRVRQKKKEREQRRLEREQRNFIESTFRDMCNEICLKTYQQALGLLPDAENPDCSCYPAHPGADKTNLDLSCSCSEAESSIGSDTDGDEWVVEFTPPVAKFDPTFKGKKVLKVDNSSQYTYLDYRVKLLDRYGNQIPRYFKGPDGRNQCSDLGGFWSPDHKWLEINNDGYIAPDGRWAPMMFTGPNGEQVDCPTGKFQTANGKWLMVGIDGYIDCLGKWKSYPRPRGMASLKKGSAGGGTAKKGGAGDKKDDKAPYKPSEASWSCFGDASPKHLSKMGIVGHGHDKKVLLATLKEMLAHGEDVKLPQPSIVPKLPPKKGRRRPLTPKAIELMFAERTKCRHPEPSNKGVVALDEEGHKTYFKLKNYKSKRPRERMANLKSQGISLSSFHEPCFSSFINAEMIKRQQYEKVLGTDKSTQVG